MSLPNQSEDASSQSVQLPPYALKHAPIVHLHKDELFFPSHPAEHLTNTYPRTYGGVNVNVPADIKAKAKMLTLPDVNKDDVFLTLDVCWWSARPSLSLPSPYSRRALSTSHGLPVTLSGD
jgi:hypothetical protein